MQRFPAPVLIDEILYAPEPLPHIKMATDAERRPGMFWLTGSQQFHLMKGVSESLAGRIGTVRLSGLSQKEKSGHGLNVAPFMPSSQVPYAEPPFLPLEIKKTASPDKNDIRHFATLERLGLPVGQGAVICLCRESLPLTETVCTVPVEWL